jgi:hypothetical protein
LIERAPARADISLSVSEIWGAACSCACRQHPQVGRWRVDQEPGHGRHGHHQHHSANSTLTSEERNNDTTAIDKDIITIVHAEFELE